MYGRLERNENVVGINESQHCIINPFELKQMLSNGLRKTRSISTALFHIPVKLEQMKMLYARTLSPSGCKFNLMKLI